MTDELICVLKEHARRYPLMKPCDAVKLIYQNEFGGGHMIKNAVQSLERLREEYASVVLDPEMSLYEDIGNGVVRVNLAAIRPEAYSLEKINDDFVHSSLLHTGSVESFIEKLNVLKERFCECGFSFTAEELDEYLKMYESAGYPMVSHSETYREAYKPAYRVIVRSEE